MGFIHDGKIKEDGERANDVLSIQEVAIFSNRPQIPYLLEVLDKCEDSLQRLLITTRDEDPETEMLVRVTDFKNTLKCMHLLSKGAIGVLSKEKLFVDLDAKIKKPQLEEFNYFEHMATQPKTVGFISLPFYYDKTEYEKLDETTTARSLQLHCLARPDTFEKTTLLQSVKELKNLLNYEEVKGNEKLKPITNGINEVITFMESKAIKSLLESPNTKSQRMN